LGGQKGVIVVLPADRNATPPPKFESQLFGGPHQRRVARCTNRALVVPSRPALREPGMLFRGVVRHEIENDFQPARVPLQQVVEIRERRTGSTSCNRNVVAEIMHRRVKIGDSQMASTPSSTRYARKPLRAAQVADAVATAVLKRARVDLRVDPPVTTTARLVDACHWEALCCGAPSAAR
jgi:hypothetical protein